MELTPKLSGMIGLANKAGRLTAGMEETSKFIKKNKIEVVLVTEDIGNSTKKQLINDCNSNKVLLASVGNSGDWMEKLRLKNKVIGIKKSPLSENIKKLLGSVDG